MRLLGPNCLGIMRPAAGINLTFAHGSANPGTIGLISQSGALCTAILDWALPNNVGFSNVVSLGAESDVDFGEMLDYMVADPRTENIFLYIEGIKNARRFMSALRAAARCKPVLLIKVGKHPGRRARPRCPTPAPWSAPTTSSTPPCAGPAWCAWATSARCTPPPRRCSRTSGRAATAWRSSPTAAARA